MLDDSGVVELWCYVGEGRVRDAVGVGGQLRCGVMVHKGGVG